MFNQYFDRKSSMKKENRILVLFLYICFSFSTCLGANCKGCTNLDTATFDKIISKFDVSLIKFDNYHCYTGGPEYATYRQVALDLSDIDNLVVGEVQLKEGGGTKNDDLAERYDITNEFYAPARQRPSLILLVRDRVNNNVIEAFKYEEDEEWEVDSIKHFIKRKTDSITITLPGCLRDFDLITKIYLNAPDDEKRAKAVVFAEKAFEKSSDKPEDKLAAEIYLKMLRKLTGGIGLEYPRIEMERVKKLLKAGQQSNKQTLQLKQKINILRNFVRDEDHIGHYHGKKK